MNKTNDRFGVVIVGAGAAGIGCGVVLKDLGIENFVILERHQVGASFSRWPAEMRFITPSFPSH
ncbi:MAG: NAD(P)-binding domain-containing protein, partial [Trichodesmium sp. St5_bin2_1]|nr:NAD(P)-binding domain-containing protein [Trichodesmium sp. St5_bin2_1]